MDQIKNKGKNKRKRFLINKNTIRTFVEALNDYDPGLLETQPETPADLYRYYAHIDKMFVWLKISYRDDLCVLCNEMRAILGHLSEYDIRDESYKKNLDKAYGHFRRLSIDTLKILCDGFDKFFSSWIYKHARYDYRSIDCEYFPKYVELYNYAHQKYIEVQKTENLGSDKNNNIIEKYHKVAKLYGDLYEHHVNERRVQIEKITNRFKLNKVVWILSTVIICVLSVCGAIIP